MYFGINQVRILLSLVKCCLNQTEEGNDVIKQQLSTCTFICLSWIERVKLNSIQNHHKYMVRKVILVFRQFVSRPLRCKPVLWNSLVILTAHFFKTSSGLSTFVSPHFLGEKLVPTIWFDLNWHVDVKILMTMTRCWYSVQDNEDDYNDYNDDGYQVLCVRGLGVQAPSCLPSVWSTEGAIW